MVRIGEYGYNITPPEQIKAELLEKIKAEVAGFEERPADLNNNLINESVIICSYLENQLQFLFNSYSPSYANQTIFEQFASEQGLRKKGAYPSYCEFKITGKPYALIPPNTKISDVNKSIEFIIEGEHILGTTGEIIVTGYSEKDGSNFNKDEINVFVNELQGLDSVTNTSPPSPPSEIEDFYKFKLRTQATWRAPRTGTWDYLLSQIKGIDGVTDRCVSFRVIERYIDLGEGNKQYFNSAELIVLGGDNVSITETIYKTVGFTSFMFRSFPSDNDNTRKIQTQITLGQSIIPFEFTRPKKSSIDIEVKIRLVGLTADSDSLQQLTQQTYEDYFNSLQVGSQINKLQLNALFFEGFQRSGSKWTEVNSIDFVCKKNDTEAQFNEYGFLDIAFDEYLELTSYKVTINE